MRKGLPPLRRFLHPWFLLSLGALSEGVRPLSVAKPGPFFCHSAIPRRYKRAKVMHSAKTKKQRTNHKRERIMKKLVSSLVLAALCSFGIVQSVDAQVVKTGKVRPPDKIEGKIAAADQIDQAQLIELLRAAGYEPTIRKAGDRDVVHLTVRRDDWTFDFDMTVSGNKMKVWLSCWFNPYSRDLNAAELAALLEANLMYGPAHFTYSPKTRTLNMGLPLDNRGITAEVLQREIEYFVDTLKRTANLWDRY